MAVEKKNVEIVKLLLANDKIDVNMGYISSFLFLIEFKIKNFNNIQNHIFQLDSKSYLSITFKNKSFNEI